jgi:spermidine synthase
VNLLIYSLTLIGSGAGFMAQMLVSGYWSTAFSEDVFYYSVNLASYLLALGLGSFLSKKVKNPSLQMLAGIVVMISAVSGSAIPLLRLGIKGFGNVLMWPVGLMLLAGTLCGMVIPLALRLSEGKNRISLGFLFFIDYTAATLFTFIFTFVCLVPLGYTKTGILLCVVANVTVLSILALYRQLHRKIVVLTCAVTVAAFLVLNLAQVKVAPTTDRTGLAKVILNEQTHYQKILMTEENRRMGQTPGFKERILFLDGFIQFSSQTEGIYHMCIADIPSLASGFSKKSLERALILGGGDGLAARNLLKNPDIKKITLVELDPGMIRLAKENEILRGYNNYALHSPKVEIVIADAFRWVMDHSRGDGPKYDLIILDFPYPKNITLSRLFSAEFYRSTSELLSANGFMTIQAGPSYSLEDNSRVTLSKVAASILKTVQSVGLKGFPYASPEEREAFVLATSNPTFDMVEFSRKIGILGNGPMSIFCRHDPRWILPIVEINTLNTLSVGRYMYEWHKKMKDHFFFYRGNHLIFLPD